jgi:outer membrane receptor for ferrienterochelin and colicins
VPAHVRLGAIDARVRLVETCMQGALLVVMLALNAATAFAQTATVRVEVRTEDGPVRDAEVVINGSTQRTDPQGVTVFIVAPGDTVIVVVKEGYAPASAAVTVQANQQQPVTIALNRQALVEEHVTVSATRTDKRVEDVPMRVEVLAPDEVQEQISQRPGDIVSMMSEMGGIQVASTSPSLGAASVRIQGMRGRYTRFLSDGLPLFGEQVGGLGLLQIPPADLGQVEIIKGVASALYGAGAMGGVVNLIARRPTEQSQEFIANRSSRGATDAVAYLSQPFGVGWGGTLVAGGHWHEQNDVDGDGWADLPSYQRAEVRPRLFLDNHRGATLFLTGGAMRESRRGGTVDGATLPTTNAPYRETLDTGRYDFGVVGQSLVSNRYVVSVRASGTWQSHDHVFGIVRERDTHHTFFGELSARRTLGHHTLVFGAALDRDAFDPTDVPQFAYTFTTPGVFVQDDVDVAPWLSLSGSARLDHHSEYGTFVSPRVSVLLRGGGWISRFSVGTGFFPTSALTEETEAAGLSRLTVQTPLQAESGASASVDLTRAIGPFSATATAFASRIHDPLFVERTTAYVLANQPFASTTNGVELLATWRREPVLVNAVYGYVRAREYENTAFEDVPLTPRHSFTVLGGIEDEDFGRVVVEWFYTGRQRLEANPFREESVPFTTIGLMVEKVFRKVRLFVNAEDVNNVRQTQYDPLVRPVQGADGRWTVDAWAPLDGRNINGGIRVKF